MNAFNTDITKLYDFDSHAIIAEFNKLTQGAECSNGTPVRL